MGCGCSKNRVTPHNDSMTPKQTHASKYVATQQQQQVSTTVNTTILVKNEKEAPLSIDTLRQYNEIAAVVDQFERKNVVQRLEEKMQNSIDLKNQASRMNEEYKQLQNKTNEELKDVQNLEKLAAADTIMNYFKDQVSFDIQMSKQQEEYIQAKSEMEDFEKRILALQSQQSKLKMEIEELKKDRDEMTKHYDEQDEILESIFKGSYGSDLENQLKRELDIEQDKKQRMEVDYQKWKKEEVITETIQKELDQSRKKCKDLQARLREERSSLMKEIIEEKTGEKVNLEEASTDSKIDNDAESDTSEVATEAEMIPEAQDLDQQIKDAQEDEVDVGEIEKVQTPADVSLDELAPAPKQEERFGNHILLMAESDEQLDEHIKEIEANYESAVRASNARAHADLQLKLKSRRSRRRRMMAQEQELIKNEEEAAMIEVPNK